MKNDVKFTIGQTRPHPILIALLFSAIVYAGNWIINNLLGKFLFPARLSQIYEEALALLMQAGEYGGPNIDRYLGELEGLVEELAGLGAQTALVGLLLSLLTFLWTSLMSVGYKGHCLSMVRGENPPVQRLFCAFPQAGGVVIARILVSVFSFLWTLLFTLLAAVVTGIAIALDQDVVSVLLILAAVIGCVVGCVWVVLRYALTDYALLDQNLSGGEAVRASRLLMRGNTGKLFVLGLSFFGWYLLQGLILIVGIVAAAALAGGSVAALMGSGVTPGLMELLPALGLGLIPLIPAVLIVAVLNLWLTPYITGCEARFYDTLCAQADAGAGRAAGYTYNP